VSDDELVVYVGVSATGTNQVFRASRPSDASAFSTLTPVDDNNGQAQLNKNPRPGWISPDGCRLYFAAGIGASQIWMAERAP
jgi:hypothetical protein